MHCITGKAIARVKWTETIGKRYLKGVFHSTEHNNRILNTVFSCYNTEICFYKFSGPENVVCGRWWWTVIFVISFGLNGYLIYQVWHKWQESPVIVSFSETTTPVWEVPFPAVTICLQTNSRRHQFHFQTSLERNNTDEWVAFRFWLDRGPAVLLAISRYNVIEIN